MEELIFKTYILQLWIIDKKDGPSASNLKNINMVSELTENKYHMELYHKQAFLVLR